MKRMMTALLLVLGVGSAAVPARADGGRERSVPGTLAADARVIRTPALEILMPATGDTVGTTVGLVIKTPANLDEMTMSAPKVGVHLHIELDDLTLMPMRSQLIGIGRNRYLFLFDLPVKPGRRTIRVYWADGQHQTLESTIRSVTVKVAP